MASRGGGRNRIKDAQVLDRRLPGSHGGISPVKSGYRKLNHYRNSEVLVSREDWVLPSPRIESFLRTLQSENRCDGELVVAKDGTLTVIQDGLGVKRSLSRREMVQRLLAGAGVGAAWPLVAASHPIHKLLADEAIFSEADARMAATDWTPVFFDAQQNESLIALSESIVPGSGKAQVNRFIDLLLSVDAREKQKEFLASLSAIESDSQKRFALTFAALAEEQKNELLTIVSKEIEERKENRNEAASEESSEEKHAGDSQLTLHNHLENLKGWISGAYYSSEAGMRELGWTGDYAFDNYPACDHAEGQH